MFIRPRVLSILTTRRCTAACDHCCVGASPRAKDAIPIERIHGLIDEAKRIPSIERIVFTGGECFLLGQDLDALIAHAHELEFGTRVVTNGYWAVNEKAARERVHALANAGLDEMMLSTGTFHQRFIAVDPIVHAAQAAAKARIATRISIEAFDQSTFDETILREKLADEIASGAVYLTLAPWIPDAGGRGTAELSHRTFKGPDAAVSDGCAQIMNVISVTPTQTLTACCGFPMEQLPALTIGSVSASSLDEALRNAPNRLLQIWLHVSGPAGIADFVARYVPGYRLNPGKSICQACTQVQRDNVALKVIAEHAAEIAQSVTERFATT
ncbi:MAG TPA: radical SAM protein [Candidatus Elarobacter sp.]|jgi:organic radical activating enzyme|nr:radical SAM protein [Candidatus Elarobacter sp.]